MEDLRVRRDTFTGYLNVWPIHLAPGCDPRARRVECSWELLGEDDAICLRCLVLQDCFERELMVSESEKNYRWPSPAGILALAEGE